MSPKQTENLYYNLARCAQGLRRPHDALNYLKHIPDAMNASARYSYLFSLIYQSLDETTQANSARKKCIAADDEPEIRALCKQQLETL